MSIFCKNMTSMSSYFLSLSCVFYHGVVSVSLTNRSFGSCASSSSRSVGNKKRGLRLPGAHQQLAKLDEKERVDVSFQNISISSDSDVHSTAKSEDVFSSDSEFWDSENDSESRGVDEAEVQRHG